MPDPLVLICTGNSTGGALAINFTVLSSTATISFKKGSRIANELGDAPSLDLEGREAILGSAPAGDASQIGGVPTLKAAERQAVTKGDRNVAAADMNAVVANMPTEISAAIAQNPATVEAQIDDEPVAAPKVDTKPETTKVSTPVVEEDDTLAYFEKLADN